MDIAVAADFDGSILYMPGGPPLRQLWPRVLEHAEIPEIAIPERIDALTFNEAIGLLEASGIRRDSLKKIARGFRLREGAGELFSEIGRVGGTLLIVTLNPFGADWINLFLPKIMPDCRIIATVPVWKNGVLSDFKGLVTPKKKRIPRNMLSAGRNVIVVGDSPKDIKMALLLDPARNPVAATFGFYYPGEKKLFENAGYSHLLSAESSFTPVTAMVKEIASL